MRASSVFRSVLDGSQPSSHRHRSHPRLFGPLAYLDWLSLNEPVLHGSLGIAHYFGLAAKAHENAATPPRDFDEIEPRELLADELMASSPLTPEQLTAAATNAIAAC
jgi:hypothetical protein